MTCIIIRFMNRFLHLQGNRMDHGRLWTTTFISVNFTATAFLFSQMSLWADCSGGFIIKSFLVLFLGRSSIHKTWFSYLLGGVAITKRQKSLIAFSRQRKGYKFFHLKKYFLYFLWKKTVRQMIINITCIL